VPTRAHQAL
jgi:predicted  nucleic acid-binding Zn-ribbon protein